MDSRVPRRVPDELDLRAEVAFYRNLTPEERGHLLAAACRAGAKLLRSRADAEHAAAFRDPLPESSLRALARLRSEVAARRRPADPSQRRKHG